MAPSQSALIHWTPRIVRPVFTAAMLALIYVAVSAIYIVLSGQIAGSMSLTVEQLQAIEKIKGIGFILVTGVLLFALSFAGLKRIQRQQRRILEQEEALLNSERRVTAGMYAATLSHDLANLLFALQGLLYSLEGKDGDDEQLAGLRRDLGRGIDRLASIAKRVTLSAKAAEPGRAETIDLQDALEGLVSLVREHRDLRHTHIRCRARMPLVAELNRTLFEEAVLNLLVNAGQAAGPEGRIEWSVQDGNDHVVIEVHDSGPGIEPGMAETIFSPTYTTKEEGTGLGLMAVKAFTACSGGNVTIGASDLGGAAFTLRFPKVKMSQPAASTASPTRTTVCNGINA